MKYIDADKLTKKFEKMVDNIPASVDSGAGYVIDEVYKIIDSLQQEQSDSPDFEAEWKRYTASRKDDMRTNAVTMNVKEVAKHFAEWGATHLNARKEIEKDLPKWKKANGKERFNERLIVLAGNNDLLCTNYTEEGEYYISFSVLEKLPKED